MGAYKVQACPKLSGRLAGTSPKVFPPPKNSSKSGMWSSQNFRELSQVVGRTPRDTRIFLHLYFPVAKSSGVCQNSLFWCAPAILVPVWVFFGAQKGIKTDGFIPWQNLKRKVEVDTVLRNPFPGKSSLAEQPLLGTFKARNRGAPAILVPVWVFPTEMSSTSAPLHSCQKRLHT